MSFLFKQDVLRDESNLKSTNFSITTIKKKQVRKKSEKWQISETEKWGGIPDMFVILHIFFIIMSFLFLQGCLM